MSSPVTIDIPAMLRNRCNGAAQFALTAATVRGVLEQLERQQSSLFSAICDETGSVRPHVNLFINSDNIRDRAGLDTPLRPGDVVTILPAVSGG